MTKTFLKFNQLTDLNVMRSNRENSENELFLNLEELDERKFQAVENKNVL